MGRIVYIDIVRIAASETKTVPETKTQLETKTSARKGGRPRKPDSAKPWIVAGLSRAAWYRQQKAKA